MSKMNPNDSNYSVFNCFTFLFYSKKIPYAFIMLFFNFFNCVFVS